MITTSKITILYDALRDGKVKIDTVSSYVNRERWNDSVDLVNSGYLKRGASKMYFETFRLTPKGRKYIKEYDAEMRKGAYEVPKIKRTVETGRI